MKSLLILSASLLFLSCKGEIDDNGSVDNSSVDDGSKIVIETNMGTIRVKLHPETAPITVANFLSYVDQQHFDGTIFHRVMSNFMIQGGGFELKDDVPTEKQTGNGIQNESAGTKKNLRGTLAMARTSDPHSATAQFFINVVDNPSLDHPVTNDGHGYAVFGEVIEGLEVVNKIKMVEVGIGYLNSLRPDGRVASGPHQNVPLINPVIIKSIRREPKS
jgi:cyclophilin family peptidyl-prolyl cis-trans isomerase